jgi:hypothetical protein
MLPPCPALLLAVISRCLLYQVDISTEGARLNALIVASVVIFVGAPFQLLLAVSRSGRAKIVRQFDGTRIPIGEQPAKPSQSATRSNETGQCLAGPLLPPAALFPVTVAKSSKGRPFRPAFSPQLYCPFLGMFSFDHSVWLEL